MLVLEQEPEASLGGQAFWSFGGLFLVDLRSLGEFEAAGQCVLVTSGGIGANHELVRRNWPERLGAPPKRMISGVPEHVDGRMIAISEQAGAKVINPDRMWHYVEGTRTGRRSGGTTASASSSLWLDATGRRLPVPLFPGFDTLGTLAHIGASGYDYTWLVLTRKIIEREFALSGSEQNPDLTNKSVREVLRTRVKGGVPGPVQAFMDHGADFVVRRDIRSLAAGMNALTGEPLIDVEALEQGDRRPRPRAREPVL